MECPICISDYDSKEKRPLLCRCGNSMCEECVKLMVMKGLNTFTCPLCKQIIKGYKENSLPLNTHLQKLTDRLDILRFPVRDKNTLTEVLIQRDVGCQYETNIIHKKYNEYLTVAGISIWAIVFLPWVKDM